MSEKHFKEKLSEFVNHELPKDVRQAIGEHLLRCADCRKEYDEIKFGATMANQLNRSDAPQNVWNEIEKALDNQEPKSSFRIPQFLFFDARNFVSAVAVLLFIGAISAVIYFGFVKNESSQIARNEMPRQNVTLENPQVAPTGNDIPTNQNTNPAISANKNSNPKIAENAPIKPTNPKIADTPLKPNSAGQILPKLNPAQPKTTPSETTILRNNSLASWNVETLAGMPNVGNSSDAGKLSVGDFLETDANSRAKIQVANIGNVEIAPNSRVKLVKTNSREHRLSLEKGLLQAKIDAPPRLFIVDTPSAVAVDLGCEYTLEVDKDGNSKLHVTSGFVALEKNGRESIVPAGAMALTKKGKGIGTPFFVEASPKFQAALTKFDFENGGNESLRIIINEASNYDTLTLWHLLSRVPKTEREKVFEAIELFVKLPKGATKPGVLKLNKKMLDAWRKDLETMWFE